jgi:hypothetical protein
VGDVVGFLEVGVGEAFFFVGVGVDFFLDGAGVGFLVADSALYAMAPGIKAPRSNRNMRREASAM